MVSCLKGIWIAAIAILVLGRSKPGSVNDKQQNTADRTHTSAGAATSPRPDKLPLGPFRFVDVASSVGIHFRHYSPLTEQRHVHLVMGSGIGWFDFDRDGWPDLYCCQGAALGGSSNEAPPSNAFFRNQTGNAFSEVTRQAGLLDTGYSMGIASADYDNDGFDDLCITGYEVNTLLHNNGDGTFTPVELPLGSSSGRLSASCAWGDFDGDGNLDLYITNYAKLGPEDYPFADFDNDGWLDVLTANGHIHDRLHEIGREEPFAQLHRSWRSHARSHRPSRWELPFL